MSTRCKCQDVEANVWYWNATQCASVQILMFQNDPRLKTGITDTDRKRGRDEWSQIACFLTVHLGLFGVENILKALIVKYGLLPADSKKLCTHKLGKLFNRLPTDLRVVWRNSYTKLQQDRQLDVTILNLTQIMERYSNSYKDARYRPDRVDTKDINLFTFLDVMESGMAGFDSKACYCLR